MTKLKITTPGRLEKLLLSIGFSAVRQRGSHVFYRHTDGRVTTIPHHRGRDISRPLLRAILRDINITPEEYNKLLEKM